MSHTHSVVSKDGEHPAPIHKVNLQRVVADHAGIQAACGDVEIAVTGVDIIDVEKDLDRLALMQVLMVNIADQVAGRTICAHGEALAWPVQSAVPKFRDEYLDKIRKQAAGERYNPAGFPLI